MADSQTTAARLALAASAVFGVVLPLAMVPASKSSPLMLCMAAALVLAAFVLRYGTRPALAVAAAKFRRPASYAGALLLIWMFASIGLAHDIRASLNQYGQFILPLCVGVVLAIFLPPLAPRTRCWWWVGAAAAAALLIASDIQGDAWIRKLVGGREASFVHNRGLVTLTLLIWPLLALIMITRRWLAALLLVASVVAAVLAGQSGAAALAALTGAAVFPVAYVLPVMTRWVGLGGLLALLAIQPSFGSICKAVLGQAFHKALEGAHSGDRVDIWLSFESAVRARWLLGNGFGSSLNLQNSSVAAQIPPERVTLLGASHPHNGFLQIWVEMGLVGAALSAALLVLFFQGVAKLDKRLQPFALTCIAVTALVFLVSHGAWQAWWIAAIGAAFVSFLILQRELATNKLAA